MRAPSFGLVLTTIVSVLLVSLDLPVRRWAPAWCVVALVVSAVISWRLHRPRGATEPSTVRDGVVVSFVCLALLLVPLALGGLRYWICRGNGTDAFNYAIAAHVLEDDSLSAVRSAPLATLLEKDPIHPFGARLLGFRWATSAVLAVISTVTAIPAVQLTTGFSLLSLACAVGPLLGLARALRVPRWAACAIPIAATAGFWAQVIVDMSALSHVHSIPLLLLVLDLLLDLRDRPSGLAGGAVLLALASAALAMAYVEILPFAGCAVALFALLSVARDRSPRRSARSFLPIAGGVAAVLLIRPELASFLMDQVSWGSSLAVNWHQGYFSWLFERPLAGLWGLHFIDGGRYAATPAGLATWGNLLVVVGAILVVGVVTMVVASAVDSGFGRPQDLIASVVVVAVAQTTFLLARGLDWAAGKSVSYVSPLIGLALGSLLAWSVPEERGARIARAITRAAIAFWLVSQCGLAVWRCVLVARDREHPSYMLHHIAYRAYDWDVSSLNRSLDEDGNPATVGLLVRDPWLAEYLSCVLGGRHSLAQVAARPDRSGLDVRRQMARPPSRFLVDRRLTWPGDPRGTRTLAENGSVRLVGIEPGSTTVLLAAESPSGLGTLEPATPSVWVADGESRIWIYADRAGTVELVSRAGPGALQLNGSGTVVIRSETDGSIEYRLSPVDRGISIPVTAGITELVLAPLDRGSRPVLVGILAAAPARG